MKIEKKVSPSCCGSTSTTFKLDQPITTDLINKFIQLGYIEDKKFTQSGIAYLTDSLRILSGTIGSNKLQIRCKIVKDCLKNINDFEELLKTI